MMVFDDLEQEIVFCLQNCSDLLLEKIVLAIKKKCLKFEAEGQEFAKKIRSQEQFIQTVRPIFETECFFNLLLKVLIYYIEQLQFEKNGI